MKRLTLFTAVLLLIAGVWRVGKAIKTKGDIDLAECDEDSYLITPPECPTEEILYFPFPYKCYQFFQCFNFEALCLRCPPGTIWDQAYTNCVPGSETHCTIVTTTVVPISTTSTEPTTTTESDDPINWICSEGSNGLIRHPYDCRFFYNCDCQLFSPPCLFECLDGLYFNPVSKKRGFCDLSFNVPDCRDGSPPPPSTTPGAQDKNDNSGTSR